MIKFSINVVVLQRTAKICTNIYNARSQPGVQGRVVRKLVNVNPGLNVNRSIKFSYFKVFFTSNVWCSLRLLQLKTEGQTI